MLRTFLGLALAMAAMAQSKPANGGFEQGELGSVPAGWFAPPVATQAGFRVALVDQGCHGGSRCALMTGVETPPPNVFGNLMQSFSAAGYGQRRIKLRAAIRVEGEGTRALLWLRLDRSDNSMAFLENSTKNPATSPEWRTYEISTDVPVDVSRVVIGVMLFGPGKAWVDDVSLDIDAEILTEKAEPPRPVTAQGLTNLIAFAHLYGYVRHFHPSDQAAATSWDTFAIDGARKVESAADTAQLIAKLRELFGPVAPTLQVFASAEKPAPATPQKAATVARYRHIGVGLPGGNSYNAYSSVIEKVDWPKDAAALAPFEAELIPGVSARVPLVLPLDGGRTLPHATVPPPGQLYSRAADDRGTRLGAVVIAWNIFQHFYPYFNVVRTDWAAELPKALRSAAADAGPDEFLRTLQRLVAALHDGHGRVGGPQQRAFKVPPATFDWVEGQFLVTRVRSGVESVHPGDRVLKIDGRPIADLAAEKRALISSATDGWMRWRLDSELSACGSTNRMTLEVEPYAAPGTSKTASLDCVAPKFKDAETYTEARPEKIAELAPGVFYIDLDRATEADWSAATPLLAQAKGIIFDMRGYPGRPGTLALTHLTDNPIRSARWNIPTPVKPDRLDTPFKESGWELKPAKPNFKAVRAFLTDGRAISYAETVMGIVENYKLGEIVGAPTAGTNGNVNPLTLPGGYRISWTGMKVLKHDGSQHHGVGIRPTVPAERTRKGVAEGRDEVLERAIDVLKAKMK